MKKDLYSIGHGARKIEDLLFLLKKYKIKYLADVRSVPFSRFHPQFNKVSLDKCLGENGIRYVFMGDTLGGRPDDQDCYKDGKINYEIVKTKDFFLEGIERLKTAYIKGIPMAIMCSERDPAQCHRYRLIGDTLADEGIILKHINEKGNIKDQVTLKNEQELKSKNKKLF
jgi:uncharacterized protein (DUF488 family)